MNNPDITLIIQALNFGIAYFILRKFIFVPALRILSEQEQVSEKRKIRTVETEIRKDNLFKYRASRWSAIKSSLFKFVPTLKVKYFHISSLTNGIKDSNKPISDSDCCGIKEKIIKNLSEVKR